MSNATETDRAGPGYISDTGPGLSEGQLALPPPAAYRALWPLALLLLTELLALIFFAPPQSSDIVLVSLGAATIALLMGLLPALLRPSATTNLIGCSAVVLASAIWRDPQTLNIEPSFASLAAALTTNGIKLSFLNIVVLVPLILHLAARFPQRSGLRSEIIFGYYGVVIGGALLAFSLPLPQRQNILVALVLAAYPGLGLAAYQFLRTIQRGPPLYSRAAQQARLLLLSLAFAEIPFLLLPFGGFISFSMPFEVVLGAQIILPIGIAYTILRNDLLGIDAALRRALSYALVSFGLLVIYFSLSALLTQVGRSLGGTWGYLVTIVSVIASAAAFAPLRSVAQRLIDRAFYPERLAFGRAVSAARLKLTQVLQRTEVITLFEHDLPQQLGAAWARLVLRPSFEQPVVGQQPDVWSMLLMVNGETLGCYWLGPRRSGLKYATEEHEQLWSLVQQAALTLAYSDTFATLMQLNHELEEQVTIRTEHVLAQQRELAAFEERQRLARDLHDSVKQTLFSLGLGLRAARSWAHSDPDIVVDLLQQQEQVALQAQVEMGDVLDQLRMPADGKADLVELLSDHCAWLAQQHGMLVFCQLPPALVLAEPLPRELTQIAREALHNVLRHSGVAEAQLHLTSDCDVISMRVEDQGKGFDPSAPHQGYGLRGIHERVAALGGQITVQSTPNRGTTLWVQINHSS